MAGNSVVGIPQGTPFAIAVGSVEGYTGIKEPQRARGPQPLKRVIREAWPIGEANIGPCFHNLARPLGPTRDDNLPGFIIGWDTFMLPLPVVERFVIKLPEWAQAISPIDSNGAPHSLDIRE